jgi:hypothetical protein
MITHRTHRGHRTHRAFFGNAASESMPYVSYVSYVTYVFPFTTYNKQDETCYFTDFFTLGNLIRACTNVLSFAYSIKNQ